MREIILPAVLAVCFYTQVWAQTEIVNPEAHIVVAGGMGKPGSQDVQAGPGVRFGLELVPEGVPKGTSVVLKARLLRPNDPEGLSPERWLVAARMGMPVQVTWEFAYDWEVEPGVWTMKVFLEDKELASVPFTVSKTASQPQAPKSLSLRDGRQIKSGESSGQAKNRSEGVTAGSREIGRAEKKQDSQSSSEIIKSKAKPDSAAVDQNSQNTSTASHDSLASSTKTSSGTPKAEPGKTDLLSRKGAENIKSETIPPQNAHRVVGGKPNRRVYALMGGAYSEEARALRVVSGLKARGVAPCLRVDSKKGKKLWHVVAGWRDSPEAAQKAKAELLSVLGEVFVQPMSAKELETGLTCR